MTQAQDILSRFGVAVGSLVDNVVFETNVTPRVTVHRPLEGTDGKKNAISEAILSAIRPRAVVNYSASSGLSPLVIAPYGEPVPLTNHQANAATMVFVGVGLLMLVLVWRGLRCEHRCKTRRPFEGLYLPKRRRKGKKA